MMVLRIGSDMGWCTPCVHSILILFYASKLGHIGKLWIRKYTNFLVGWRSVGWDGGGWRHCDYYGDEWLARIFEYDELSIDWKTFEMDDGKYDIDFMEIDV